MIELFLNAAKLLASKDVRESSRKLLELVHQAPQWQQDICTLTLKLDQSSAEVTHLIRILCVEKLANLGYYSEVVESFQTCYTELVANALEHGCSTKRESTVEVEADITKAYIALRVKNTKGVKVILTSALQEASQKLRQKPDSHRGRGLLLVNSLADEFEGQEDNRTVKAVFYKDYVKLESFSFPGLTVLRLRSGLFNPSCPRRIEDTVLNTSYTATNLILDLSLWRAAITTLIITKVLRLNRIYAEQNLKFIAIVSEKYLDVSGVEVVKSWEEALILIGSLNLLQQIQLTIPRVDTIVTNFSGS